MMQINAENFAGDGAPCVVKSGTPSGTGTTTRDASSPKAPKISVIVPVYKVEKYLAECIESVLAQTFTDFELILVDDGSPDNSGKICDTYAARDSRIRVFHKENGGVSSARNLGLDRARGEWIAFVDSDDWIEPEMLNELLKNTNHPTTDFVYCRFWINDKSKQREVSQGEVGDFPATKILRGLLAGTGCGAGPYCKLYRGKIIKERGFRFCENISIFEDLLFVSQYLRDARMCVSVPAAFYHYVIHNESAMHCVSARLSRERIRALELLDEEFKDNDTLRELLNRRKVTAKFSVIKSQTLSRKEILGVWKNVTADEIPFLKKLVLKIYPTPMWWMIFPAIWIYNLGNKMRLILRNF